MRRVIYIFLCILTFAACRMEEISYSDQIKPIINKKCLQCHGGIKKLGGYSLLFPEEALAKGESGKHPIVPGNARQSELIKRIKHQDPDLVMPQDGPLLTEKEIELLEKWIDQGAKFDAHWAYRPLKLVRPSEGKDRAWSPHPVDAFMHAKMKSQGLTPNRPATRPDLVRRLAFDLTGLPPEHHSALPFLEDSTQNISSYIDTLLASKHFGEHFASWWLDLARFADSNGYEKDMGRSIWRYRDYVIDAFNNDLPFDSFTVEQLAGDLLPGHEPDQLLASAFHRNTMTNTEGGTEDEEFRTMSVIDRVNTTFEIWQASTMSCVQCHAHPYDPYRHEDFFKVMAFFNNTQDADLDSEYPYMLEHDSTQQSEMKRWASKILLSTSGVSWPEDNHLSKEDVYDLISPRLFGDFANDFEHVLINHNGSFNNSSYNANNQKHKQYYLLFEDIAFDKIKSIKYNYHSNGSDARIDVYLDSITGTPIASTMMTMPATGKFVWLEEPIDEVTGEHDLILHFVNTSGDFRTGVVSLREIELGSEHSIPSSVRTYQDSLLKVYRDGIKTPILKDKSDLLARTTQVFERGNYLVKGDTVAAAVPPIFESNTDVDPNRLALAQWLIGDQNPLTPRVIVNRIWGYIFGRGLVSTTEDFGTQGENPTHPALLEYLSYQFANEWQWSLKTLIRNIVTSATYQQAVATDSIKMAIDPNNIWYSRANRTRLSAEQIRDQALAVSDLLNDEIGGASVMPHQPEGVWQVVYSSARWEAKDSTEKYRRGLYTYWKRTTPYPSMMAFDSPSREFCVSRRITTNTPLQALVTLNDPAYIEAAEHLGEWMETYADESLESAITAGYQRVLCKKPRPEDVNILVDLYRSSEKPASKVISFSHEEEGNKSLAPMTIVANALMNLDAFLTKS